MLGAPQLDAFISRSVWAIATTLRREGSPTSSMVGYARDGDELLFSAATGSLKGRTLARDPRINLTVVNAAHPMSYVSIEGVVTIDAANPAASRQLLYDYWHRVADRAFFDYWDQLAAGGSRHHAFERVFAAPGRAIYTVTPTRVSGLLL